MRANQVDVQKKWNELPTEEKHELLRKVGFVNTAYAVMIAQPWSSLPKWLRKLLSKEMSNGRTD